MKDITIFPKTIENMVEYEGITFSKCTFIEILIDGESIEDLANFESGVVYREQLKQSASGSGEYLLFTCYCGIPEDAGWDYIKVTHTDSTVKWEIDCDAFEEIIFSKSEYVKQIANCESLFELDKYPLAMPISGLPHY